MASQFPSKLDAQALGVLGGKAIVYPLLLRGRLGQGDGADIPDQETEVVTRMNNGADDAERLSYLGTPVFADLWLKEDEQDEGLLIDAVLFDVSMQKVIVKTEIPGRKGSVKEYISDGDYAVSIRGMLVSSSPSSYPNDEVKELLRLIQLPQAIVAVSPFLQLFGIYELVVENYSLPQLEGYQNVQPFQLDCISDVPIQLIEEDV